MTSLIDGVFFSAYSPEKHPRDAHGHFLSVTDGPEDLQQMLREIDDPAARLIAADRMEDLGRPHEARMLRSPEHPLIAVRGGVFYAPGSAAVSAHLAKQPGARLVHVRTFADDLGDNGRHGISLVADGFRSDFDSALRYVRSRYRRGQGAIRGHQPPERADALDSPSGTVMARLHHLQLALEDGQHHALPEADFGTLARHLKSLPPWKDATPTARARGGTVRLIDLSRPVVPRLSDLRRVGDRPHDWMRPHEASSFSGATPVPEVERRYLDRELHLTEHERITTLLGRVDTLDLLERGFVRRRHHAYPNEFVWLAPSKRLLDRLRADHLPSRKKGADR